MTTDERIKAAALELGAALTEGGKHYWVYADTIDVTRFASPHREFAYVVSVEETATRIVAP